MITVTKFAIHIKINVIFQIQMIKIKFYSARRDLKYKILLLITFVFSVSKISRLRKYANRASI